MGNYGWNVPAITREPDHIIDERAISNTLIDWLFSVWREFLDNDSLNDAENWFGELLTIGVEQNGSDVRITFWFNESVEWPRAMAEHWVKISCAAARIKLDIALSRLGLALRMNENDDALTMASVFFKTADDCPLCKGIKSTEIGLTSEDQVVKEFTLNHIDSWSTTSEFQWIPGDDRFSIYVARNPYSGCYVYASNDGKHHFRYADFGSHSENIKCAAVVKENDNDVGLAVAISANDSTWFKTYDGGRTWKTYDLKDKPPGTISNIVANGPRVIAWSNDAPSASLYISNDSARSFGKLQIPLAIQIDKVVLSPFDAKTFYIIIRSAIAVTNDDGTTFRLLGELPFRAEEILITQDPKVICVAGTEYDGDNSPIEAYIAHSADGGETFTITRKGGYHFASAVAHPNGMLFVARYESGVVVSRDGGLSWSRIVDEGFTSMTVDSAQPGTIICHNFNQVFRLGFVT